MGQEMLKRGLLTPKATPATKSLLTLSCWRYKPDIMLISPGSGG